MTPMWLITRIILPRDSALTLPITLPNARLKRSTNLRWIRNQFFYVLHRVLTDDESDKQIYL